MPDADSTIDVVFVDDHWIVRQGLRAILEEPATPPITILGEAISADEALDLVEKYVPDVLIADLKLGRNFYPGLELIRKTRRISPHTKVLVLTAFDQRDHLLQAMRAGASGCISKADQLDATLVRKALNDIVSNTAVWSPIVFQRLHELSQDREQAELLTLDPLTRRELEVLELIAGGATNKQIAEDLYIAEKTVKTHVSNILTKLHLSSRHQAADHFENYLAEE
jgi:DNA-binding NarL/FixJ family response regulator